MRVPCILRCCMACLFMIRAALPAHAESCNTPWPAWQGFREHFISEGGRVIDPSSKTHYTTSEGQSYALFFALVDNDPQTFSRLLEWTEANLAGGDLTSRLPAWEWGQRPDGSWGVLDENAAADADLWLAYTLSEAGLLWKNPKYAALGELLADRILREESAELPGLGRTLLPGPRGFHPDDDHWRLNPSYVPLQLVHRMASLYPESGWPQLAAPARQLLLGSAVHGFAPDWVIYAAGHGFEPDPASGDLGSFNAIRVYLWAGMLSSANPDQAALLKALAPMGRYVASHGTPPLQTHPFAGNAEGTGSVGFSAALLPLLAALRQPDGVRLQRLRLEASPPQERLDNYYDQALALFGRGWLDDRFKFARDGRLVPHWTCRTDSHASH